MTLELAENLIDALNLKLKNRVCRLKHYSSDDTYQLDIDITNLKEDAYFSVTSCFKTIEEVIEHLNKLLVIYEHE